MKCLIFPWLRIFCLIALFPGVVAAQDLVSLAISGDLTALKEALPEDSQVDPETLTSPLFFAAQRGHEEVVTYLLSRGADPDSATRFGTALGLSARNNHTGIVKALLDAGADPNLPGGDDGRTALHHAAERGAIESARLLIDYGADVNVVSLRWDWPAIHFAAKKDRTEMVAFLREMGAGPEPVDALGPGELEAADPEEGRFLVKYECGACHGLVPGAVGKSNPPGPNLFEVVGRDKASLEDYPYSEAMKAQAGNWTPEELNVYLADPLNVVPGTNMPRGRQTDRAARVAIIAYLTRLTR